MAYNNNYNKGNYTPNQSTSTSIAAILDAPIALPKILENKMSADDFKVIKASCFPAAKDNNIVALAIEYCRVRKLDVMKKMVHIVSFNGKDNILPSIAEARVTATRTGTYVGKDAPVYGPNITKTFKGTSNDQYGNQKTTDKTLVFPEWCEVTVYRFVQGKARAFTERVEWEECVQMNGTIPNSMWSKRVKGQLAKCAEAASLRTAFPEELGSLITAEEIEGNDEIHPTDITPNKPSDPVKDALNQMKIEDEEDEAVELNLSEIPEEVSTHVEPVGTSRMVDKDGIAVPLPQTVKEPVAKKVAKETTAKPILPKVEKEEIVDVTDAVILPPNIIIGDDSIEVTSARMGIDYLTKFIKAASLRKVKQDLLTANEAFISWLYQNEAPIHVDKLHALAEEGK